LLAAELMALALLKFPKAPAAFRLGLAETLREEQRHTRWYLARMRECGVEFGQYPLSGYFWDAVSPMESPLDYVSRLSLTFEQANLDYARHYSRILAEAGDAKSASILRKIYEDEIQHVGYGLHWFRQWKDPSESDWGALQKRLPFPLSPSRAKGNRTGFNEEGRRAAGFDEDYIRRLACFERSKGRTPNVFYFNPEAEHRAARWPAVYHPDATRLAVGEDLELLAGFLARRDDVLLLRRAPSTAHLEKLARCGFALPEIELLSPTGSVDPSGLLASRRVDRLRPWAIAPDLADRFAPLRNVSHGGLARAPWTSGIRSLYSKIEQAGSLARWMGPSIPCASPRDLAGAAASLRAAGHRDFVLKRAFSTAGSGLTPIRDGEIPAGSSSSPVMIACSTFRSNTVSREEECISLVSSSNASRGSVVTVGASAATSSAGASMRNWPDFSWSNACRFMTLKARSPRTWPHGPQRRDTRDRSDWMPTSTATPQGISCTVPSAR
jgi:hypothetical protein